jgi:ferredoxin-NADP reductase
MRAAFVTSERLTDHLKTYWFKPEAPVDYIPGQFLEFTLAHSDTDNLGDRRWFTLSSSPTEPLIAITIRLSKAIRHSTYKQALDRLQNGDEVHISDPMGDFVLPLNPGIPLVWIAGGIGITPFRSMAKWLSDNDEQREILLFHSVRNTGDSPFNDIFDAAHVKKDLNVVESLHDSNALIYKIAKNPKPDETLFYISGPEYMTSMMQNSLQSSGIDNQQIITDAFLGY